MFKRRKNFRTRFGRRRRFRKTRINFKGRRKVSRYQKSTANLIRQPTGLPDRLYVKMRLVGQAAAAEASGQQTVIKILGNGMFDPLGTTLVRPYLYNQWCLFYQNWKVYGSRVRLRCTANGGPNPSPMLGILPSNKLHSWGPTDQLIQESMPYCKFVPFKMGAVGVGTARLTSYMGTSKIFGMKRALVENDENYWGAQGADPNVPWYWYIFCYDQGGATNSAIINFEVTYYACFCKRDLTAPSP